jgi:hypothetical protein
MPPACSSCSSMAPSTYGLPVGSLARDYGSLSLTGCSQRVSAARFDYGGACPAPAITALP